MHNDDATAATTYCLACDGRVQVVRTIDGTTLLLEVEAATYGHYLVLGENHTAVPIVSGFTADEPRFMRHRCVTATPWLTERAVLL